MTGRDGAESVKVLLKGRAGETESIWCTVVDAERGLFRVASIPLLRVRPTYGDVIAATRDRNGMLTHRRVHTRGPFRVAALEYAKKATFRPLVAWLASTHGVVTEGVVGPRGDDSGVVALAIPASLVTRAVLAEAIARYPEVWPLGERPAPTSRPGSAKGAKPTLASAVAAGDMPLLRKLLRAGAKLDARNEHGNTAAFLAARRGDLAMLRALAKAGANVLARDARRETALHTAAAGGFASVVKLLLAAGAKPDDRPAPFRRTALHLAATRDWPDVAALLLAAGARHDVRDDAGFTPLMCAAYRGHARTARVLLAHGATNQVSEALLLAAAEGYAPMVKLLLAAGGDPAYRSPRGDTALGLARRRRHKAVVALLA